MQSLPIALWFGYSPISACKSRVVYSYPHAPLTSSLEWRPFWCSRTCGVAWTPENASQLSDHLKHTTSKVRVVGGGHSPTDLQCVEDGGTLVVIQDSFCDFEGLDRDNVATFGAGCTVEYALKTLLGEGRQLYGFGGIAEQRMGGAISTSLHGQHTTSFSDNVVGITSLLANGSFLTLQEADDTLRAWTGSMGRLGVITKVRIRTFPLQFVNCTTVEDADVFHFRSRLSSPSIVGFEAKRLLSRDTYTVRTCSESQPDTEDVVVYENKDSVGSAFLVDNVALPIVYLIGKRLVRSTMFANTMINAAEVASSREGIVASVNDYRVSVSFNPHFDEEYSIPWSSCHDALEHIRSEFPELEVHAFLRRVDGDRSWTSWSPNPSCAIRLEYYDYSRHDFVEFERMFRFRVEHIVLQHNGSGHRGKLWYRTGDDLLRSSPRRLDFEHYRSSLDPSSRFENVYTSEMKREGRRVYPPLPVELQVRAFLWRLSTWFSIGITCLVALWVTTSACIPRGFDSRPKPQLETLTHAKVVVSVPRLERHIRSRNI